MTEGYSAGFILARQQTIDTLGPVPMVMADVLPWDTGRLYLPGREPFPSQTNHTNRVFGDIRRGERQVITSHHGMIFNDGMTAAISMANRFGVWLWGEPRALQQLSDRPWQTTRRPEKPVSS